MIYNEEHYNQVLEVARSYRNDVERLEKQLAITEKALVLATEYISCLDVDEFKCNGEKNCTDCKCKFNYRKHLSNHFKTKAKEELENE